MERSEAFFTISERQQVTAGLPSAEIPLDKIGETASDAFALADACGAEVDMFESFDQPQTLDIQNRIRDLKDRRGVLSLLGMKLAGTPEAGQQLVQGIIDYTYSRDVA